MKQMIFKNWNFMRLLRLMIGIAIVVQSVLSKDPLVGLVGVLLTGLAVFNAGCCGAGRCGTPVQKIAETPKDIDYEEVV